MDAGAAVGVAFAALLGLLLLVLIVVLVSMHIGGKVFRAAIKRIAKLGLKVGVEVDTLVLNTITGRVAIKRLQVMNPKGWEMYPNLFEAGDVELRLNMGKIISSRLKIIEVQQITFKDINVNYQPASLLSSNLQSLVEGLDLPPAEPTDAKAVPVAEPTVKAEPKDTQKVEPENAPEVILHKIEIVNVGVTAPKIGSVYIPNIEAADFDKSHGARKDVEIGIGIAELVVERVLENTKKATADMLEKAKQEGLAMAKAGLEKIKEIAASEQIQQVKGAASEKIKEVKGAAQELLQGETAQGIFAVAADTIGRAQEAVEEAKSKAQDAQGAIEEAKSKVKEYVDEKSRV